LNFDTEVFNLFQTLTEEENIGNRLRSSLSTDNEPLTKYTELYCTSFRRRT
jgi:hypothetical protein